MVPVPVIGDVRPDLLPRILAVDPTPPSGDPALVPARGRFVLTLSNPCGHPATVDLHSASRAMLSAYPGRCPTCPPPGSSVADRDEYAAWHCVHPDPHSISMSYNGPLTLRCAVCGATFETTGGVSRARNSGAYCPDPGCRQVARHRVYGGPAQRTVRDVVADVPELLALYAAGGGTPDTRNVVDPHQVSARSDIVRMWLSCEVGHVSRRPVRSVLHNMERGLVWCLTCRWGTRPEPTAGVHQARRTWDPDAPENQSG